MKLYLDDDSVATLLVRLLKQAGHDVVIPADVGQAGAHDAVHLRVALVDQRTLLTHNNGDFKALHDLMLSGNGHHSGVFIVCKENDPTRDMRPPHIVRAIANVLAAAIPIADEFITLNHWR